jgi:sterol desaturase/sphingolipid hydroxylase (fatty acid hydroxylase superfamily)
MEPASASLASARKPLLLAAAVACAAVLTVSLAARWDAIIAWIDLPVLLAATGRQFERLLPVTVPTVLAFAALLLLERVIPARPQQGTVSRGFCEDVLWVVLYGPMIIFGAFWFGRAIGWLFQHPLAGASVNLQEHLPFAAVVVICFVLGDFLAWVHHYLKHRIPLLWRFHAVHHSALELNPFTDSRVHLAEYFVNMTVVALPFFMIGGDAAEAVVALSLARLWNARFHHANIRTNLGPLRHVIVSPQYHRMHHSIEPRDADKNLGAFFTIWDRIFGTRINDDHRYPDTGIADPSFPHSTSRSPIALLRTFCAQLAYPFRATAARRQPSLDVGQPEPLSPSL